MRSHYYYTDGRTKEMDQIFKAQDKQMESLGRKILSDHIGLKRSDNIKSSDELYSEKQGGTVGLGRNVLRSNIQTPKL